MTGSLLARSKNYNLGTPEEDGEKDQKELIVLTKAEKTDSENPEMSIRWLPQYRPKPRRIEKFHFCALFLWQRSCEHQHLSWFLLASFNSFDTCLNKCFDRRSDMLRPSRPGSYDFSQERGGTAGHVKSSRSLRS